MLIPTTHDNVSRLNIAMDNGRRLLYQIIENIKHLRSIAKCYTLGYRLIDAAYPIFQVFTGYILPHYKIARIFLKMVSDAGNERMIDTCQYLYLLLEVIDSCLALL